MSVESIINEIQRAKAFIDIVILSGGEPLLQYETAKAVLLEVKKLGLLTGLQTNGFYYDRLDNLIREELLDAVFMDVKAPLIKEEYARVNGGVNAVDNILKSIDICSKAGLEYFEARTTIFKGAMNEDIKNISTHIPLCSCYVLQQGRPEVARMPYEMISLNDMRELAKASYHKTKIRSLAGTELII